MRKSLVFIPIFLVLTACGAMESETSETQGVTQLPKYLALGDSIAFGYTPLVSLTHENVAKGLFVGYPEILAGSLQYAVTNSGCPGETTYSFIDNQAKDNGCHSGDDPRHNYLKVDYTESQLDFAVNFLSENPDTQLVTITVGGNDLLLIEDECDGSFLSAVCKATRLPAAAWNFAKNIDKVIKTVKSTGFDGDIVFVTQYPRNYKDPIQKLALGLLNSEVKTIAHFQKVKVASGFESFEKAAAAFDGDVCKAGLMVDIGNGECNQHPSLKGAELLAQTVLNVISR